MTVHTRSLKEIAILNKDLDPSLIVKKKMRRKKRKTVIKVKINKTDEKKHLQLSK